MTESECWVCGREFTAEDEIVCVDAADEKLVHDNDHCRRALVKD